MSREQVSTTVFARYSFFSAKKAEQVGRSLKEILDFIEILPYHNLGEDKYR